MGRVGMPDCVLSLFDSLCRGELLVGQYAVLKREPDNPYDQNAIRVDNMLGLQVPPHRP